MTALQTVLDDLCSRFILNIPEEEFKSSDRLFFQIEQAHWFYLDFYRERNPQLPNLTLQKFGEKIFKHVPFLVPHLKDYDVSFDQWRQYKLKVPVYGAIMLNRAMDKVVLVKGWTQRSSWGFPKGKVNQNEKGIDCAVREVYEETGYDITPLARADQYVEVTMHDHRIRLYIVPGVDENTYFCPRTRKEISKVEWWYISDLPRYDDPQANRFYMVTPFVKLLKQWLSQQKKGYVLPIDWCMGTHAKGSPSDVHMAFRSGKQRGKAANQQAAAQYTANEDTSSLLRQMLGVGAPTSAQGMGGDPQRTALIARMPQTLAQFSFDRDRLLACMAPFLQSEPQ